MMTEAQRADERAQEAFHACLVAYTETGSWANPATDAYLNAERDFEWEEAKAAMDAVQQADHDYHIYSGTPDEECDSCQEDRAEMWSNIMQPY